MLKIRFQKTTTIAHSYIDKLGAKKNTQIQMNEGELMYVASIQDDMIDNNYIHVDCNEKESFTCSRNSIFIISNPK